MAAIAEPQTLGELLERLGVPADRIRYRPAPGTATEADVRRLDEQKIFCELIDGVLVEKVMGARHSRYAAYLTYCIIAFLERVGDIGAVYGPDAPHRLFPGQIRYPDVSFVRHDRKVAAGDVDDLIAAWTPNLAVEVISPGNTAKEMDDKLKLYLDAGVELVWYADPDRDEVRVYTSLDDVEHLGLADELDGGLVLPGFRLSIEHWFTKARSTGR
jgi:Uma2 family endonuclease